MFRFATIAKGKNIWVAQVNKRENDTMFFGIGVLSYKDKNLKITYSKDRMLSKNEQLILLDEMVKFNPECCIENLNIEIEVE